MYPHIILDTVVVIFIIKGERNKTSRVAVSSGADFLQPFPVHNF